VNPLGAGLHETQLQQELSAALEQQAATREILRKHNGLWFYDESYVISRRRD